MRTLLMLSAVFVFFACSSGEKEEQAENQSPEEIQNSLQKEMEDVQREAEKAVKKFQSGEGNGEVVDYQELKALFPEKMAGIDRIELVGQKSGAMGFKISSAEAKYQTEDRSKRIKGSLNDTAGFGAAMMSMAAWANMSYEREGDNGFERTTKYKGYPAIEKYDTSSQRGEISVIIAGRFILSLESYGISFEDLKDALDDIGLKKLERLG